MGDKNSEGHFSRFPTAEIGNKTENCHVEGDVKHNEEVNYQLDGVTNLSIGNKVEGVEGKNIFYEGNYNQIVGANSIGAPNNEGKAESSSNSKLNYEKTGYTWEDTSKGNPSKETNEKSGRMIIFNQQEFDDPSHYRIGSDKDVNSLKATFSKYGVDVIEKPNLKLSGIKKEIEILSKFNFTGHKSFMCVLLTHGGKDGIVLAKDDKFHHRETIINPIIKNKTLNGIVKIFIIVACRGPYHYYENDLIFEDGCILSEKDGIDPSKVLICYSTCEGQVSLRRTSGSYYIQNLCRLIDEGGTNTEFHSILLDLNECLIGLKKQVPPYESSMNKFYLRDLLPYDDHYRPKSKEIKTIVMCGETGVGKSTLGNFIVNVLDPEVKAPFAVMHNAKSCPMATNVVASVETDECVLNVIDTPGFEDTEGEELNALNVCHFWKALESVNVSAVLFMFRGRFTEIPCIWYERLLNAIPKQYHENLFIVHTQYGGEETDKVEDLKDIRRLSKNPSAKISHVLNGTRLKDHKEEISQLVMEWTSLPSFTVKNLKPPEVVYERQEVGPIEERFFKRITVSEEREESYQEDRREFVGKEWRHGRLGKISGRKKDKYKNVPHTLYRTVPKEEKDQWVKFQKLYRVRYDQTKDEAGEKILEFFFKQ